LFCCSTLIFIYNTVGSLRQASPASCPSIPVPCPDWGPSSRSPRQCSAVMKVQVQVQSGSGAWSTLSTAPALLSARDGYQTVLPTSTRPFLGAIQRLPYRAHTHPSRLAAPCTASDAPHSQARQTPIVVTNSIDPDCQTRLSAMRQSLASSGANAIPNKAR
jgi:hypothetical protein